MVILPFWTSVLVRTYAWLVLLQRTGLVNKALLASGLIDRPVQLAYNQFGTIIAMVHILLPFMVLPLYSAMQKIPPNLSQAGASLGGSPLHVFLRVFLPLSMSGVLAGVTLVFVLCLGFYITPELMGGGKSIMVSMVVSRNVEIYNSWGAASAVSVVLLICVFAIFYAASRVVPLEKTLGAK
jgi:putative spermidine/putrescine transport system permease protein